MTISLRIGLFVWFSAFMQGVLSPVSATVADVQLAVLRSVYRTTNMGPRTFQGHQQWFPSGLNSSVGDDYCLFGGVTCDKDGYVASLDLANKSLSGSFPDMHGFARLVNLQVNDNRLGGGLESVGNLTSLRFLSLGNNCFSSLPDFTANTNLRRISIPRNWLTGQVPDSICSLPELLTLDLSGNTKMWGTLPECLSELQKLTKIRITDIGLVGTVPVGLCGIRDMNGLAPNRFGCDAIGCAAGSFQRAGGRKTDQETACEECRVPSNVIGSTRCRWSYIDEGGSPSSSVTSFPSTHDAPSFQPSPMAGVRSDSTAAPTMFPSVTSSTQPTWLRRPPALETLTPSEAPLDSSISGISEDMPRVKKSGRHGLIAGGLLVAGFVCLWVTLFVQAQGRKGDPVGHCAGNEEATCAGSRSDSSVASALRSHNAKSSFRRPIILETRSDDESVEVTTKRRVRFTLPMPLSWSSEESGCEVGQLSSEGAQKAGAWASWMMFPIFDSSNLCSSTKEQEDDGDDDESSIACPGLGTSKSSALLSTDEGQDGHTSAIHFCLETTSRQQGLVDKDERFGVSGQERWVDAVVGDKEKIFFPDTWDSDAHLVASAIKRQSLELAAGQVEV